ncbi:MAG: hypothetical protein ACE5JC_05995 [Candidatus Zixiibacteriota bacterium]
MVTPKGRPFVFAALVVLFILGAAPLAKTQVEMTVDPYAIFTSPGRGVNFTLAIINHDRVSYNCHLAIELWTPTGHVIHYPGKYFMLQPDQTIMREVTRTVPVNAPMGEYVLWFNLYDRDTGRLLATTHCHIFVGWSSL